MLLNLAVTRLYALRMMEPEFEKVVASLPSVGRVTKVSRTPRRARGLYVLPVGTSPRRSPRLLAKRRKLMQDSLVESTADSVQVPSTVVDAGFVEGGFYDNIAREARANF